MSNASQRLSVLENHLNPTGTLKIEDTRTGKKYEIDIYNNYIDAKDIGKLQGPDGLPLRSYDPAFMNTISCTSSISYIDGDRGILEYRGYPIEELAEKSNFLEVSYLLLYGELPTRDQYTTFESKIMTHTYLHTDVEKMMHSFNYDAHPMGQVVSTMAAVSTFHPEVNPALHSGVNVYKDERILNKQIHRIIGQIATIAACAYRHRIGRRFNTPGQGMSYVENFLYMMDKLNDRDYRPHPVLVKALDILFVLHADHELNCSTAEMRHLASSEVDVYTCISGAAAALYGRRHGGANEAVLRMLEDIGSVSNIPDFVEKVKAKKATLMGFGHRVYKNHDPRARLVRKVADQVFEVCGREPLIDIAMELEKIALSDDYFISRKLYPNVDFYSGVIYKAMGFPTDMFPVLFTIPRVVGWLAHWKEFQLDPENKIVRPRQNYIGYTTRKFTPIENREMLATELESVYTDHQKRREVSLNAKNDSSSQNK